MHQTPTTPDPVLQHLDWVRALSLSLVRDAAAADDVVQEVWLVAMSKMPQGLADPGSVRQWLAGVARNVARNLRRGEARRHMREEARTIPESAPSSHDLVARSEQLNRLAQMVLELDEPFRRTMLLRWFEGRSTAEIASLERVRVATVHTRLFRGKAQLRERLDAENGGQTHEWALAMVPMAARALATGSGKKLVGAKGLVTLGVCLVTMVAGLFVLQNFGSPKTTPEDFGPELVPISQERNGEQRRSIAEADSRMDRRSVTSTGQVAAPADVPELLRQELRILALRSDGGPAPDLRIDFRRRLPGGEIASGFAAKTDEDGRTSLSWADVVLRGAHEAGLEVDVAGRAALVYTFEPVPLDPAISEPVRGPSGEEVYLAPPTDLVVLRLPPTGRIEVRTFRAPGEPLPLSGSMRLTASHPGHPAYAVHHPLESGVARFEHVELGLGWRVRSDRQGWLEVKQFQGPSVSGDTVRVDLYPSEYHALYSARLVDEDLHPLPDFAAQVGVPHAHEWDEVISDGEGRILFGLLHRAATDSRSIAIEPEGWAVESSARVELEIPPGAPRQVTVLGDIALEKPVPFYRGVVVDASNVPIEGATVQLAVVRRRGEGVSTRPSASMRTNDRGEFWLPAPDRGALALLNDPGEVLRIKARDRHRRSDSMKPGLSPRSGIRFVLPSYREIAVRLNEPAAMYGSLTMVARRVGLPNAQPYFPERKLGSAKFHGHLPEGTWTLSVHPRSYYQLPLAESQPFEVTIGGEEPAVVLELPELVLAGRWRKAALRFEDSSGEAIDEISLTLQCASTSLEGRDRVSGEASLLLPSEPVTITARSAGYRSQTFTHVGPKMTILMEPEEE